MATAPPAWAAEAKTDPHRRAGRFLLGPMLGQGGMGTVFEAWDPFLRRRVAIKLLHRDSSEAILRFLREAELQARVSHPNICPIHEVVATGDAPMIVMQRLDGPTLWDVRGRLAPRALAELMEPVARAVHAAHQARMVHRDLKPANIILEPRPEGRWHPYVVDFGLARALDAATLTLTQAGFGTPAYMPPEQLLGKGVDARTDVYALGATFSAVLRADGVPGPAPVPGPFADILDRCQQEDPQDRYQTAEALAEDLNRFLAGAPVRARAPWTRALRRLRRNPSLVGALVLSLTAVSASGIYAVTVWNSSRIRLEAASRFEEEVKGLEGQVRHARTRPPHDIRPELAQVEARLADLKARIPALPGAAQGPALFALGRGCQLLRRPGEALVHLKAAWDHGYQAPQVAYALGIAYAELDERSLIQQHHGHDPEILPAVDRTYHDLAAAYLEKARGVSAEAPSYPRAVLAFCRRSLDQAILEAQAAYREVPWLYEAKYLEGRYQTFRYYQFRDGHGTSPPAGDQPEAMKKAWDALAQALKEAPCDEEVLGACLDFQSTVAIWRSEHGRSEVASFEEGLRLGRQAQLVNPGNEQLRRRRISFATRWAYAALAAGLDPRPALLAIRAEPLPSRDDPAVLSAWLGTLADHALVQAEYEWRNGLDPLPTLAWAEATCQKASDADHSFYPDRADLALMRAKVETERGLDPAATLDAARAVLDQEDHWDFFYPWDLKGQSYACQARHALATGRDPFPDLVLAREALEESIRLAQGAVYPQSDLASALALGAQDAIRRGAPPGAWVQGALDHARTALAAAPAFPRCRVAMDEALTVEVLQEAALGQDPRPALAQLRTVAGQGLRDYPKYYLFEHHLALADLMEACLGSSPALFSRALQHAQRALAIKPATPEALRVLAIIHACRQEGPEAGRRWLLSGMPPR